MFVLLQDLQFVFEPTPNRCRPYSRTASERVWSTSDWNWTGVADVGRLEEPRIRETRLVLVRGEKRMWEKNIIFIDNDLNWYGTNVLFIRLDNTAVVHCDSDEDG